MSFFLLPQKLPTEAAGAQLHALLLAHHGSPVTPGWSASSTLDRDGWLFRDSFGYHDTLGRNPDFLAFFHRHGTGWVETSVQADGTPVFWPVIWRHHGTDGAVVEERTVFDMARRAGWFDSTYRHTPTAHAKMAALAQGERLAPPPLPR
jgi:hypothetical protein